MKPRASSRRTPADLPAGLPPGPSGLPIIGSAVNWTYDRPRFLVDTHHRYGRVARFNFLNFRCVLMFGAEANRFILVERRENFLTEPVFDLGGCSVPAFRKSETPHKYARICVPS